MDSFQLAQNIQADTIEIRRRLHQHPELSFQEYQTSALLADILRSYGFEVTVGVGQTGVVALLRGSPEKPCIMLRFDMDALPVNEDSQAEYCSKIPGKMHACGHDAHMAIGLGVARLLAENRDQLDPTIKIVFQPAEEIGLGALQMIEAGVLQNPKPDYTIGLHVWNEKPFGWVSASSGPVMAGSDMFRVVVKGKGGHGAAPHQTTDPIIAATQIVTSLHTIVSRNLNPLDQVVISVGSINGGTASNIIPNEVELTGTIRYFKNETQALIHRRMREIVEGIAKAHNCQYDLKITESTKPVVNDVFVTEQAIESLRSLGQNFEIDSNYQTLISEDMAFFLERVKGVFLLIGSGVPVEDLRFPHHHPRFDIDEQCMTLAIASVITLVAKLGEMEAD